MKKGMCDHKDSSPFSSKRRTLLFLLLKIDQFVFVNSSRKDWPCYEKVLTETDDRQGNDCPDEFDCNQHVRVH